MNQGAHGRIGGEVFQCLYGRSMAYLTDPDLATQRLTEAGILLADAEWA